MKNRLSSLAKRLVLALFLVLVFAGVAWDETGESNKHLWADLAIGVGAAALVYAAWWSVKRSVVASKTALRQGYQEALALEGHHARRFARWLADARKHSSRPEHREAMVRDVAGRAGRFVGSAQRAFRENYGNGRRQRR